MWALFSFASPPLQYAERQRWVRKLRAVEKALHSVEKEFDWDYYGHLILTARRP
jgi:hypothetical protein